MPKTLHMVSATQIELFKQCPRLWVERYILGHKLPATDAMMEGLEVHQAIEAFLKQGAIPAGKWKAVIEKIKEQIVTLDLAASSTMVEYPVKVRTDGPWFTGSVDIFDPRGTRPIVYDIKSKSSFDYILNEFQVASDVQMAVYAKWALDFAKADEVQLTHIYALRDEERPQIKLVTAIVKRDEVEKVWDGIHQIVLKMVEYAKTIVSTSLEVPGNEKSCFAYGKPCHYLNQCSPEPALIGLKTKKQEEEPVSEVPNNESLLDRLRRQKAGTTAALEVPAAAAAIASVLPPDAPSRETPISEAGSTPVEKKITTKKKAVVEKKPESLTTTQTLTTNDTRVIYINCLPEGRTVTKFSDWVRPIEAEVATKNKVGHWKHIDYGKDTPIMACAMKDKLQTLPQELCMSGVEPAAQIFFSLVENVQIIRGW